MKVSTARDSLVDEAYALNTIALHFIRHLHGAGQRRLEAADAASDLQHNAISTEKIPAFQLVGYLGSHGLKEREVAQ